MGQHLQLYASKNVSLSDAKLWCNLKLREYDAVPSKEQESIFQKVRDEMGTLERSQSGVHQEHWSAGHGVACFRMLDCEAHDCDETLVEKARQAGREHNHHLRTNHPECAAAKHDWENDDAVKFLLSHIGFVVWGYNDGV